MKTKIVSAMASGTCTQAADALANQVRETLSDAEPRLLAAFASTSQPLPELVRELAQRFPGVPFVASSTSGEFTDRGDAKGSVSAFVLSGDYRVFAGIGGNGSPFEASMDATEVLPLDDAAARLAGRINADLERAGGIIGMPDVMVAAIALRGCVPVVTGNVAHFEQVHATGYELTPSRTGERDDVQADRGCTFNERNAARHCKAVDAITENAVAAGGREVREMAQDTAFMYSRGFEDLDGHIWGPLWMHPDAAVQVPEAFANAAR